MADAERDVDPLLDQIDRAIEQQEFCRHGRIGIEKRIEDRPQHHLTRHHGRSDREQAAGRRARPGRDVVGLLQFGEHAPTDRDIALALLAQLDGACGPVQQLGTDPLLQESNGAAHRRRRTAELAARSGKAAVVHRKDKHLHRIQTIHTSPTSPSSSDCKLGVRSCRDNHRRTPVRHSFAPRKSVCRTAHIRSQPAAAYLIRQASPAGAGSEIQQQEPIMGIEQKVAIVTGASQGIGAALVQGFRDRNYRVVATARSIKPSGDDDVLAIAGDIADRNTAERVVSQAVARFGRVDTLVNNAGIFVAKPFTQYTAEDYAAVMGTNVAGFFHVTQLAIAEMEKQGSGHVVQITTTLVDQANSNVPSVLASLSKGGLSAATKSLAIEYAKRGIRVNAVSPGIIKSPMHPVATHAQLDALHPVGHMGEMSDIVDAVLYLEGASFVTGEILHVDGGQSAGH